MKIGVSVLGDISKDDGTTVRAKRIFRLLKERYNTTLITRGNANNKLENTIVIKPERTKLWNLKLIPIIVKNKFDCIYCSNDYPGFITYYLFSKIYKYNIIFEAHGIASLEYEEGTKGMEHKENFERFSKAKFKTIQILERFVTKSADHIIALSQDIYNFYKKYNNNITIIPVFVDEDKFKMNREAGYSRYNEKDEKRIGLIGPFYSGNINTYFLNFLYSNLNRFNKKLKFVIIGKCDNKIKIKDERIIYTGYLDDVQDYVDFLSGLNAVLVPSKVSSYGALNKILEPMSCSLPVFTTPKGLPGLDYVKNGKDILVFEEEELVDKVNELIFDDKLMNETGKNARITVEKYYSKKANEKKLLNILRGLCK